MGIGEVGREARGAATPRDDLIPEGGRAFRRRMVMDGDRHAPIRERAGQRPPQPPAAAGHQRDAAAELHQDFPLGTRGEMGRIWPVTGGVAGAARDITPSVMSLSST